MYGNIVGYTNSSISSKFIPNYEFHHFEKQKEDFMSDELDSYLGVIPIRSMKFGDELLVSYNYRKPPKWKEKKGLKMESLLKFVHESINEICYFFLNLMKNIM